MQDHLEPLANGDETTGMSIHSGFPNPAAERQAEGGSFALNLNQLLIRHPSSTYLFRISGEHWAAQGIFDGDIAIVDRALQPVPHDTVLIWSDDTFELHRRDSLPNQQSIWGVVNAIIHPRT